MEKFQLVLGKVGMCCISGTGQKSYHACTFVDVDDTVFHPFFASRSSNTRIEPMSYTLKCGH